MVNSEAVLRRLNFVRIRRRNRRDFCRMVKRAFHHVQPAEAFVIVSREKSPRQTEIIENTLFAKTLVLQVVNRENRSRAGDTPPVVARVEHCGNEPRRPVVAVHDVGNPVCLFAKINRRAAEKREAISIILALGIHFGRTEEVIVFAEGNLRLVERHIPHAAIRIHPEPELHAHGIRIRSPFPDPLHGSVKRRKHTHFVSAFRHRLRQRRNGITKSARFRIRSDFGRNHQNLHSRIRFF